MAALGARRAAHVRGRDGRPPGAADPRRTGAGAGRRRHRLPGAAHLPGGVRRLRPMAVGPGRPVPVPVTPHMCPQITNINVLTALGVVPEPVIAGLGPITIVSTVAVVVEEEKPSNGPVVMAEKMTVEADLMLPAATAPCQVLHAPQIAPTVSVSPPPFTAISTAL